MRVSATTVILLASLVSADLDSPSLLQQFYAPGRLLGNSFGNPGINATYDYVVVGAGLAGALTASRIADALPNMTVAVIEAGSFYEISNGNYSQIPYYSTKVVRHETKRFITELPKAGMSRSQTSLEIPPTCGKTCFLS